MKLPNSIEERIKGLKEKKISFPIPRLGKVDIHIFLPEGKKLDHLNLQKLVPEFSSGEDSINFGSCDEQVNTSIDIEYTTIISINIDSKNTKDIEAIRLKTEEMWIAPLASVGCVSMCDSTDGTCSPRSNNSKGKLELYHDDEIIHRSPELKRYEIWHMGSWGGRRNRSLYVSNLDMNVAHRFYVEWVAFIS